MDPDNPGQNSLFTFRFKAMNTSVSCTLPYASDNEAERLQQETIAWFQYAEQRFSRFRPASELVRLNERTGTECLVSSAMLEVLQLADAYRELTEGTFSPFVLDALQRCGYDRSFERLPRSRPNAGNPSSEGAPRHDRSMGTNRPFSPAGANAPAIAIAPRMKSAKLPAGARIDLGGIVKGWAVRRWAAWLRRTRRLERGLVNAGGDLAVWGGGPDEAGTARPWRIGIEHPWASGGETGLLLLGEGASATSGTLGRRWETPRGTMHHLIDPATMRPSDSDVVQCTASGGDLVDCEVWAKTLCILGSEAGLALLARARPPVEMLLFSRSGDVIFYGDAASLGTKWQDVPVTRTVASDH